jgi:hypothetical protein
MLARVGRNEMVSSDQGVVKSSLVWQLGMTKFNKRNDFISQS